MKFGPVRKGSSHPDAESATGVRTFSEGRAVDRQLAGADPPGVPAVPVGHRVGIQRRTAYRMRQLAVVGPFTGCQVTLAPARLSVRRPSCHQRATVGTL